MTDFATGDAFAKALAIQADGKIVLAGQTGIHPSNRFALARYHP